MELVQVRGHGLDENGHAGMMYNTFAAMYQRV